MSHAEGPLQPKVSHKARGLYLERRLEPRDLEVPYVDRLYRDQDAVVQERDQVGAELAHQGLQAVALIGEVYVHAKPVVAVPALIGQLLDFEVEMEADALAVRAVMNGTRAWLLPSGK